MTEREKLNSLIEISKKEGNIIAAFEACGNMIESLRGDILYKNIRIETLEKQLAEAERKLAEAERKAEDVQN